LFTPIIPIRSSDAIGAKGKDADTNMRGGRCRKRFCILEAVRAHGGIENNLHWALDVIFDEDRCRTRKDNPPLNFTVIRRAAFNILKVDKTKGSLPRKRLRACIDPRFRTHLFPNQRFRIWP
jgi:hypothetical protein